MKKRWISWLLVFAMLVALVPQTATEARAASSGTCGDNLTWVLDDEGTLTISGTGEMEDFSHIAPWYNSRSSILYVIVHEGVTSIGGNAFDSCENLTVVTIPDTVTSIGYMAFRNCTSLTSVTIPSSVVSIGYEAFQDCTSLTSVTIPSSVTTIGYGTFTNCRSLTSVTIPSSVTSIGDEAFAHCESLIGIWVDSNNPFYSNNTAGILFNKNQTELMQAPGAISGSYVIPNSVISIGIGAFCGCTSLTNVTIPSSVTSIGINAFCGCTSLTNMTIPSSVTSIGAWAFEGCTSLTSVTIPSSVTSIGNGAFCDCDSLTSVTIPSGVTSVGRTTFCGCTSLTSVTIPNSVTSIDHYAFFGCTSLTNVTIPSSVTSIGYGTFSYCDSLTDVYFIGTESQWNAITIDSNNECLTNATIHYSGESPVDPTEPTEPTDPTEPTEPEPSYEKGYPDVWQAMNHNAYFGADSDGYYIASTDYNRLISNLSNTEREAVTRNGFMANYNVSGRLTPNNYLNEPYLYWSGSCFGMSAWVLLNDHHVVPASSISSSTHKLYDYWLTSRENTLAESAINYYHHQQCLPVFHSALASLMQKSQVQQLRILEQLGKNANETGKVFLIAYSWYYAFNDDGTPNKNALAGHAVIGYGWEEIEPIDITIGGFTRTYTHRILVYDCADSTAAKDRNIYYNDGAWCIPGWGISSSDSQSMDKPYNNAVFMLLTDDSTLINGVDFRTGAVTPQPALTSLSTSSDAAYAISWDSYTADISGMIVSSDVSDHGITVFCDSNVTADGAIGPTATHAVLPDSASYTITSDDETMAYSIQNEHYLTYATLDAPGSITFASNGNTAILTGAAADFSIDLVANDGYHALPWYEIAISGTASAVSAETAADGILVSGDDLTNLSIYAESDEETLTLTAESEEDTILITEGSGGTLTVCEDHDDDGIYETEIASSFSFTDVPEDSFYYASVLWAVDNGITNGLTDTTFGPDAACNRAQVVTFLWRAEGCPEPTATSHSFVDVQAGSFYEKAVLWAVENGITTGTDATHFSPNAVCNRATVVTFLHRAAGAPAVENANNPFSDVPANGWFTAPVLWAVEQGITNGLSATEFGPTANCNRAQVVTFLYRAYTT